MIELEDRGAVTVLRMARGKGNALNLELLTALVEALDQLERSSARAVVITGQGFARRLVLRRNSAQGRGLF